MVKLTRTRGSGMFVKTVIVLVIDPLLRLVPSLIGILPPCPG